MLCACAAWAWLYRAGSTEERRSANAVHADRVVYAACVAFGRDRTLYSVMFVLALIMELYRTGLVNWTWAPLLPGLGLSAGKPPFAAGAFYALLDLLVLASVAALASGRAEPITPPSRPNP